MYLTIYEKALTEIFRKKNDSMMSILIHRPIYKYVSCFDNDLYFALMICLLIFSIYFRELGTISREIKRGWSIPNIYPWSRVQNRRASKHSLFVSWSLPGNVKHMHRYASTPNTIIYWTQKYTRYFRNPSLSWQDFVTPQPWMGPGILLCSRIAYTIGTNITRNVKTSELTDSSTID